MNKAQPFDYAFSVEIVTRSPKSDSADSFHVKGALNAKSLEHTHHGIERDTLTTFKSANLSPMHSHPLS